ncbi:hypothetical protein [Thiofilum flexile]|uniref:hypothetical protein n=1 Tax=Thiofilum flexile TaxID=125627 RepID=UPI000381B9E8|nr:hypothetical protein [Thiofilum flexile]
MKKIFIILLLFFSSNAIAVNLIENRDMQICSSSKTQSATLSEKTTSIYSTFASDELVQIMHESHVGWWEVSPEVLGDNCVKKEDWYRPSSVSPPGSIRVFALVVDNCTFKKPKNFDPQKPVAQFTYRLAYKKELGIEEPQKITTTFKYGYSYVMPNTDGKRIKIPDQRKRQWGKLELEREPFCYNIYLK